MGFVTKQVPVVLPLHYSINYAKRMLCPTDICQIKLIDLSVFRFQTLCLRQNLITKIENLDSNVLLRDLDLYDNLFTKIENLDSLVLLE